PGGQNEAPTIFKKYGTYWMITSGCTGWAPNAARMMKAKSITGPWEQLPNPCRGEGAKTTFDSQGTYILEHDGEFFFMADRWNPKQLNDSRHLWIPIRFDANGTPYLEM
ncbi:MAG: beta-glucanase, partial [Muribaculaceae bacterium]|nr:beta-glucanase [Muribaculaceae bacterium]